MPGKANTLTSVKYKIPPERKTENPTRHTTLYLLLLLRVLTPSALPFFSTPYINLHTLLLPSPVVYYSSAEVLDAKEG